MFQGSISVEEETKTQQIQGICKDKLWIWDF